MITDPFAVVSILVVIVFLSTWLENNFTILKKLGSALIAIIVAIVFANIGVIPASSSAYDMILHFVVSAAIVLVLLEVDFRTILSSGSLMIKAFFLGALGTFAGTVGMGFLLSDLLGPETWKLCGLYAGTYTGGGVNFAAVQKEVQVSPDIFNAALAADMLVTAFWLMVCLVLPLFFSSSRKKQEQTAPTEASTQESKSGLEKILYGSVKPMSLENIATLVAITFVLILFSEYIASIIPIIPGVISLTVLTIFCAQLTPVKKLVGASVLGHYLLLLFFASNGAQSVISNIIEVGPAVFYFSLGVVLIHGAVIFGVGWLLKFNIRVLAVASQANVGGAASAIAIASTRGYIEEIGPGVAVALLGYMIGNFIGLGASSLMFQQL